MISRKLECFVVLLVAACFAIAAGSATGQINVVEPKKELKPNEIKDLVGRTAGVKNLQSSEARSQSDRNRRKGGYGPGDHPVFLLHASREFAQPGETIEFNLVSMVQRPQQHYQIYGMILKPGPDGDYDGSVPIGYFNSETGNGYVRGSTVGQFIRIHTRMFTTEENYGTYLLSFLIYNEESELLQQIWVRVYMTNAGVYGRSSHVDKTELTQNGLALTGRFPYSIPIYYFVGVPKYGFTITGPDPISAAYSHDGRNLEIPGRATWSRDAAMDVMMWSPYTREAIIKPNAYVEKGFNSW